MTKIFETERTHVSTSTDYILIWIKLIFTLTIFVIYEWITGLGKFIVHIFTGVPVKNINGQIALVTGGGNGLGKAIAIELAKKGCNVAIADINFEAAVQTSQIIQDQYKIKSKAYKVDVSQFNEVSSLKTELDKDFGSIDILVNNAGVMPLKYTIHSTAEETENIIGINLLSQFWTIRVFIGDMKQKRSGHILSIASMTSVTPLPIGNSYTAGKYGVLGLMESLNCDLITANLQKYIRLSIAFPFFIATNDSLVNFVNDNNFTRYYPVHTAEYTAECIIDGMLKNKYKIYVPKVYFYIGKVIRMMPNKAYNHIVSKVFFARPNKGEKDF